MPNPANSSIRVVNIGTPPDFGQIMDVHGRVFIPVSKKELGGAIDIEMLPSGVYLLALTFSDGSPITLKFVKSATD